MRRALPALLLLAVLALSGCGDDDPSAGASPDPTGYSEEVRGNFLTSCVENARTTSKGAATDEQLTQTCECILGKVEKEYSQAEFTDFEQRLLANEVTAEESEQLKTWSTDCAREATS